MSHLNVLSSMAPEPVIPDYRELGIVTELALHHFIYDEWHVDQLVERVSSALQNQRGRVFFNEQHQPIGYLSWAFVDEAEHQLLMSGKLQDVHLADLFYTDDLPGFHFWIIDTLSPFQCANTLLEKLRHDFPEVSRGYGIQPVPEFARLQAGRIW